MPEPLQPVGCSVAIAPALRQGPFTPSNGCFDNFDFECLENTQISGNTLLGTRGAASDRLLHYCGDCHGTQAGAERLGTFGQINNLERMTDAGLLVRCSAERSRLVETLRAGTMPPADFQGPRMEDAEIDLLALALDDQCRIEDCLCESSPSSPGCEPLRLENMLDDRCGSCHGSGARTGGLGEGMTYIDDLQALVGAGQIVPCAANQSPLLARARDSTSHGFALPAELGAGELDELAQFVDGMCLELERPSPERAENELLLRRYCGSCHGQNAVERGAAVLPFSQVEDTSALIDAAWIVPCVSRDSPVVQRIRDGSMPPADSGLPKPTLVEIEQLARFIDLPCARPRSTLQ